MKKILAVSGGIDSMVMLDLIYRQALQSSELSPDEILVAHFNHGIRPNAQDDSDFVARQAQGYGLKFCAGHLPLGADCSEEKARQARYDFLYRLAAEQGGQIYTAHHADDAVESIIINLLRGTGWRGLAPLSNSRLERPLLNYSKADIYRYAADHRIVFREDQTNTDSSYLRNRVRDALIALPKTEQAQLKSRLLQLFYHQREIYQEIKLLLPQIVDLEARIYSRALFFACDDAVALELLRFILDFQGISQTRPQLQRALAALRTYAPGKKYSLDRDHLLLLEKYNFRITNR